MILPGDEPWESNPAMISPFAMIELSNYDIDTAFANYQWMLPDPALKRRKDIFLRQVFVPPFKPMRSLPDRNNKNNQDVDMLDDISGLLFANKKAMKSVRFNDDIQVFVYTKVDEPICTLTVS
jgi:hypothetical protein